MLLILGEIIFWCLENRTKGTHNSGGRYPPRVCCPGTSISEMSCCSVMYLVAAPFYYICDFCTKICPQLKNPVPEASSECKGCFLRYFMSVINYNLQLGVTSTCDL